MHSTQRYPLHRFEQLFRNRLEIILEVQLITNRSGKVSFSRQINFRQEYMYCMNIPHSVLPSTKSVYPARCTFAMEEAYNKITASVERQPHNAPMCRKKPSQSRRTWGKLDKVITQPHADYKMAAIFMFSSLYISVCGWLCVCVHFCMR